MENATRLLSNEDAALYRIPNAATGRVDIGYIVPGIVNSSQYDDPVTDQRNWRSIQWMESEDEDEPYRPGDVDCYAYVQDNVLFLPSDGQSATQVWTQDGQPDPNAGWYDPATGVPAIVGLPGAALVRFQ